MTKPALSAKAPPKVWKEDQIPRVFKSSYDQPTGRNGDESDVWEYLPNRYLSRWHLVQPQPRRSLLKHAQQKKKATQRGRPPKEQTYSHTFSHCPRVALPESGKFQRNVVLYGWLRPNNDNPQKDMILVCISDLDRWVINRSKEQRGYWISSQKGSYWLQDPCTHKVSVYSPLRTKGKTAKTESNDGDSKDNAKKRRRKSRVNSGKEKLVDDNNKNASTQEKASTELASQADVHLQHRLRLGLLSVMLEELATKKDDELVQVSQFDPLKMLAYLKRQQSQLLGEVAEQTLSERIFDWKLWQPHSHFIGSYILLYHVSLSVESPLLLGMFGQGERVNGLPYETGTGKRKSGGDRKRRLSEGCNPHCNPEAMLELALQVEQKVHQTHWGQPMSAMSMQTPQQSSKGPGSSSKDTQASAKDTQASTPLGMKAPKPRGRGGPRKNQPLQVPVGLKESSKENSVVTIEGISTLGPLKKPRPEPAPIGPKSPKATNKSDAGTSTVRPRTGTPAKITVPGILKNPRKDLPDNNVKPKRVKFHKDVAPAPPRKNDEDDVSVGSTVDEPIVVDSDTDESDEDEGEEEQEYGGPIFRFRRGAEVVALCVHARDLSISMKEVVEKATEFGESDKVGVFQWSPRDKKKFREGKANILFRVGLMNFTKDHFYDLTAQDTVDIAPLSVPPPNPVTALPVGLHIQPPSEIDVEVCINTVS